MKHPKTQPKPSSKNVPPALQDHHHNIDKSRLPHIPAVKLLKPLQLQDYSCPIIAPQITTFQNHIWLKATCIVSKFKDHLTLWDHLWQTVICTVPPLLDNLTFHDNLWPTIPCKLPHYKTICIQWYKNTHHWCIPKPHIINQWYLYHSSSPAIGNTSHRKPHRHLLNTLLMAPFKPCHFKTNAPDTVPKWLITGPSICTVKETFSSDKHLSYNYIWHSTNLCNMKQSNHWKAHHFKTIYFHQYCQGTPHYKTIHRHWQGSPHCWHFCQTMNHHNRKKKYSSISNP